MAIVLVILGLVVLIVVHELGHFLAAKMFRVRVDEFGLGFPPRLWSRRWGETVYSFNLLFLGGFVKIPGENGETAETATDSSRFFSHRPIWQKLIILLGGIVMNVVLGWLILSFVFMVGSSEHLLIAEVAGDSPAAVAGLRSGDIVTAAVLGETTLADPVSADIFTAFFRDHPEEEATVTVRRGEETVEIKVAGRKSPPPGEGAIGVALADIGFPRESFWRAFGRGAELTAANLSAIARGLGELLTRAFSEPKVLSTVSGPVGIIAIAAKTASLGFVYFLQLLSLISLNLAVLNLIPFPALDGGRILLLVPEAIRRRPVSEKFQMIFNATGFVLLLALMLTVTVKDILGLFG